MRLSTKAFDKLVRDYKFETVLDIGSGAGEHARAFADAGKKVTAVDLGSSVYFKEGKPDPRVRFVKGNFMVGYLPGEHDVVWASHILEHQRDVGEFLHRAKFCLSPNGVLAVTVPPLKHEIVGGHVSLWNTGLLLYNLILAGFDCSKAAVNEYDYNISVIVSNKNKVPRDVLYDLHNDWGDIGRLKDYFPMEVKDGFDGRLPGKGINW